MHLGNHIVEQDFVEMDIDKKFIESVQCKHWMDVEMVEVPKVKAKAKAKSKKVQPVEEFIEPLRGIKKALK